MAKDYYKILELSKGATKEEIKKAYRKLAHQYHPDKKDGDEAKFKEVNEAYSILSDDNKRSQYDNFGQTFSGNASGGFGGFDFSNFNQAGGAGFDFDLNDILGSFFSGGGWSRARKGKDIAMDTEITFKDSILGLSKEIEITRKSGGKEKIQLNIPPGIDSGEMIRYKGKGEPLADGIPGDLYIKIHVKPDKKITKEGIHLITEEKIKLSESLEGTKKTIQSVDGDITIKIPRGIRHGEILRIKNKGVPVTTNYSGDLLVKISIEPINKINKKIEEAIEILKSQGL